MVRSLLDRLRKSRYPLFVTGGFLVFLFEIGLTYVLTSVFRMWYFHAYTVSISAGAFLLFMFHRVYTFNQMDRRFRRMTKFILVIIVVYVLNLHFVHMLTSYWGEQYYLLSIIVVNTILSVFHYYLNKNWVFRHYE